MSTLTSKRPHRGQAHPLELPAGRQPPPPARYLRQPGIALRRNPALATPHATFTFSAGFSQVKVHALHRVTNAQRDHRGQLQHLRTTRLTPNFSEAGKWYNYLTGDSITVANPHALLNLSPGDFAVYTSTRIRRVTLATRAQLANVLHLTAAPNPASGSTTLQYELPTAAAVQLTVRNVLGQNVLSLPAQRESAGPHLGQLPLGQLAAGVYIVQLRAESQQQTLRLVVE